MVKFIAFSSKKNGGIFKDLRAATKLAIWEE